MKKRQIICVFAQRQFRQYIVVDPNKEKVQVKVEVPTTGRLLSLTMIFCHMAGGQGGRADSDFCSSRQVWASEQAAAVKTFPCAEAIHRGVNIDLSTKLWHEWYISAARVEKCSGKNTILYVLIQLMFWPSSRSWFDCGLLPIPKVSKIVHQPGNQNSQSIRHCIDKRRHRRARDIKR